MVDRHCGAKMNQASREAALRDLQQQLAATRDELGRLRQTQEQITQTLAELADIQGMGEQKIERFGAAFLDVLRNS